MAKTAKGYRKTVTIWLEASEDVMSRIKPKMFYCFNCKVPVVQYYGDTTTIVPGNAPYTPATLHKCKGNIRVGDFWEECGMYYVFMPVVFHENPAFV